MNNEDLQQEFEYFVESLNYAYCLIKNLLKNTNNALLTKNIISEETRNEVRELEQILFYLDNISLQIKDIIEDSNYIKISNTTKDKTIDYLSTKNNLLILPIYPDEDIYVDKNKNLTKLWKEFKKNND